MPLRADLFAAYRKAHYVVFPDLVLRIGEPNARLDALLAQHGAGTAAFVTAANPDGEVVSEEENRAATAALRAHLAGNFVCLEGEGRDPDGAWTPEPSLLVLGIAREEAGTLGRAFDQNAIVFIARGGAPELVVLAE